jgi:hypothetical protein
VFRFLRVKSGRNLVAPDPESTAIQRLLGDSNFPVSIFALVNLPESSRRRLYRVLLPPRLLTQFEINPYTWEANSGEICVHLTEKTSPGLLNISIIHPANPDDPFFTIELQDNALNGIDLNFLIINNPESPRFNTDINDEGKSTLFGTVNRNVDAEIQSMQAGLSPGQTRVGLRASREVFAHIEAFFMLLGHQALFLEPLTYTSAWIFEKRGLAYIRGHKLMDTINKEFSPGGLLDNALNGSTIFRQSDMRSTVRGRAWAIHDGILEAIDARWDDLRMIKQIGKHAGANTFPNAIF